MFCKKDKRQNRYKRNITFIRDVAKNAADKTKRRKNKN